MQKILIGLTIMFGVIFFHSNSVFANNADAIAFIASFKGDVSLSRGTQQFRPEKGQLIYLDDVINTYEAGRIELEFVDESSIALGEDAELIIDAFIFDTEKAADLVADFNFVKGGFLYISGTIGKKAPEKVSLRTPMGSIGIRGTKVWGGMWDKNCYIYVEDGAISVSNEAGQVYLSHGQVTRIADPLTPPDQPVLWAQDRVDWIKSLVAY